MRTPRWCVRCERQLQRQRTSHWLPPRAHESYRTRCDGPRLTPIPKTWKPIPLHLVEYGEGWVTACGLQAGRKGGPYPWPTQRIVDIPFQNATVKIWAVTCPECLVMIHYRTGRKVTKAFRSVRASAKVRAIVQTRLTMKGLEQVARHA